MEERMTKTMLAIACAAMMTAACGSEDAGSTTARPKTQSTATSLSKSFGTACASCHGDEGQGQGEYPALPGDKSESAFIAVVRSGAGTMPAFSSAQIADATLKSDYAWLKANR